MPGFGGGNGSPFVSELFDMLEGPVGNVLEFVVFSAIMSIPRSLRWILLILKLVPTDDIIEISFVRCDDLEAEILRGCPLQAIGVLLFLLFLLALLLSNFETFDDVA